MENLTGYSFTFVYFWLIVSYVLFMFHIMVIFFGHPLMNYRKAGRRITGVFGVSILFSAIIATFGFTLLSARNGTFFGTGTNAIRIVASLVNIAFCAYWYRTLRSWGMLLIASFLILPLFDFFMPWNVIIGLIILSVRMAIQANYIFEERKKQLTTRSLQEAIDLLDEGLLFCDADGKALLSNIYILQFMDRETGRQFRQGFSFWKYMKEKDEGAEEWENALRILYHGQDRRCYLIEKKGLEAGEEKSFIIMVSDVTEIEKLTEEIRENNVSLKQKNEDMKQAILDLERIQREKTIQEVMSKVHDIIGQRITILQQLLNNRNYKDYHKIAPLIENLMEDLRRDVKVGPQEVLRELFETYHLIGVEVVLRGMLPEDTDKAGTFVEIIREAMSNAVRHGKASKITVTIAGNRNERLTVSDNGVGIRNLKKFGTGLAGINRKILAHGGRMILQTRPHFTLIADLEDGNASAETMTPVHEPLL